MVQALTSRWGDARVPMSIGLSIANNTLAGFRYETVLTMEAALMHSICLLQITRSAALQLCVCAHVLNPLCLRGSYFLLWERVSAIINSEIKCSHLRWQVQVCLLCSPPAVMRQQYRALCRHLGASASIAITPVLCFPSVLWPVHAACLF